MIHLRDSIIYCGNCGAENFYDAGFLKTSGKLNPCWSCQKQVSTPPRIRIEKNIIMLNHDTRLFPHHTDPQKTYDFSKPVAQVSQHPKNPKIWGLRNLSDEKWVITAKDGSIKDVESGQSTKMAKGTTINFGRTEGDIRL